MEKEISIYVHVPFCNSKCYYCSFSSSVENETTKTKYFKALNNEIEFYSKKVQNRVVKTIYFGGGTPSVAREKQIEKTLKTIKKCFKIKENCEITIELNPNSTTKEKLLLYKKIGINRLSFGVQSFNRKALEFVGRIKKEETKTYKKQVLFCLKTAKEIGFENVSVDFILGLPFQKKRELCSFFKTVSHYVSHFSCYMLQIEKGTKLFEILKEQNEDVLAEQYEFAVRKLKKLGFERYEVSNFAKQGFESKHNQTYWERKEYLGFGISAHSFLNKTRKANTLNLKEYIDFWNKKEIQEKEIKKVVSKEKLSKEQEIEEEIMLSLRTKKGLDLEKFEKKYYNLIKEKHFKIEMFLKNNLIEIVNNFLSLTEKGFLLANEIIVQLF